MFALYSTTVGAPAKPSRLSMFTMIDQHAVQMLVQTIVFCSTLADLLLLSSSNLIVIACTPLSAQHSSTILSSLASKSFETSLAQLLPLPALTLLCQLKRHPFLASYTRPSSSQ